MRNREEEAGELEGRRGRELVEQTEKGTGEGSRGLKRREGR